MDSQTAWSICMLLRKLADNGQAVLCTIHQPSSQLFCMFDRLLLLNRQGETVYFGDVGPNASTLIGYIESHSDSTCPPDVNPADWVLEITSTTQPADGQNSWSEAWRASPQYADNIRQLSDLESMRDEADRSETQFDEYATSWVQQVIIVCKRLFREDWRDPPYLYTKVFLCIGMVSKLESIKLYCRLLQDLLLLRDVFLTGVQHTDAPSRPSSTDSLSKIPNSTSRE